MVTPVRGWLVVDDACEARTKSRVIGVGLAVEVRRDGGGDGAWVPLHHVDLGRVVAGGAGASGGGHRSGGV